MPLTFPIASDARAALSAEVRARTLSEARAACGEAVALVCEWLRPDEAERGALAEALASAAAHGFTQVYEDARGQPVIAVSYWKPESAAAPGPSPEPQAPAPASPPGEDHTDDLYFDKSGRSRAARRLRRERDAAQLDLFAPPAPSSRPEGSG
jgi:hypothetical protein